VLWLIALIYVVVVVVAVFGCSSCHLHVGEMLSVVQMMDQSVDQILTHFSNFTTLMTKILRYLDTSAI